LANDVGRHPRIVGCTPRRPRLRAMICRHRRVLRRHAPPLRRRFTPRASRAPIRGSTTVACCCGFHACSSWRRG